jgi:hypothetical protein
LQICSFYLKEISLLSYYASSGSPGFDYGNDSVSSPKKYLNNIHKLKLDLLTCPTPLFFFVTASKKMGSM